MLEPCCLLGPEGEDVHSRRLIAGDLLERSLVTRLFLAEAERYLWGRWRREHSPLTAYHFTRSAAERQVEQLRAPGAAWMIRELPALVLEGSGHAVVITELGEPTPLGRQGLVRPAGRELLALADQLTTTANRQSLLRLVVPRGAAHPAKGPFLTYRSITRRPGEQLGWTRARTPPRSAEAAQRLVDGINSALGLPHTDAAGGGR